MAMEPAKHDSISSCSEEEEEDFVDGYSTLSADVSESEGSCCSCSSSFTSSSRSMATTCCDSPAPPEKQRPALLFPVVGDRHVIIPAEEQRMTTKKKPELTEVGLMKERFAKLLLGEDISGGGNGVCTALAISNAINKLAATVFGELWKLEPLSASKQLMWAREMEWLLCVCDFIVELVPSVQEIPGNAGRPVEVMVPQQRPDLSLNLPVLKKLDAMLIGMLDGFQGSEFYYVDRGMVVGNRGYIEARRLSPDLCEQRGYSSIRLEEKWWLPFPKVPKHGLSQKTRKQLEQTWKCTNHIYKAALAINNAVLSEMEVPKVYLDSLPKSPKACLGEALYGCITASQLPTEGLDEYLDLSSEQSTLEIANKLEASLQFWRQKSGDKEDYNNKRSTSTGRRLLWSRSLKGDFAEGDKSRAWRRRAENLLRNLKLHFRGLPQTTLDKAKIHHNKDVGLAILDSYSRVIENIAHNMMARIEDLLYIDDATRLRAAEESMSISTVLSHRDLTGALSFNFQDHHPPLFPGPVSLQINSMATPPAFRPPRLHGTQLKLY